tara:strand:+ start:1313 stop:1522 length:210 start_codon:yes stop_codon:yes gene_type:complete
MADKYTEYFLEVEQRYRDISEREKNILRRLIRSEEGQILAKVLGPNFMAKFRLGPVTEEPRRKRGLAAR